MELYCSALSHRFIEHRWDKTSQLSSGDKIISAVMSIVTAKFRRSYGSRDSSVSVNTTERQANFYMVVGMSLQSISSLMHSLVAGQCASGKSKVRPKS
jgi:hypothetical protein